MMSITCCSSLDWLLSDAGQAGLSVIICNYGDELTMHLQARACEASMEPRLKQLLAGIDMPNPIRVIEQTGIRYCPFCGKELSAVLNRLGIEADRIASSHRKFDLGQNETKAMDMRERNVEIDPDP